MLHITKIKPMYNYILTTGDKFEKDMTEGGIITSKAGELKLWQTVIAIGSAVRDIEVGDLVMIDPKNYAKKKYNKNSIQNDLDNNPVLTYEFPWEAVEDEEGNVKECLFLSSNDIRYVFEGHETDEDVIPNKSLILPGTPKLIL